MGYAARHGLGRLTRRLRDLDDQQRVRELAQRIPDEARLRRILDDCQPGYRDAVKAQLWPYLSFTLVTEPPPPVPVQELLDLPTAVEAEGDGVLDIQGEG